jgi:DNA-binding CsgD family transcriptional regulator
MTISTADFSQLVYKIYLGARPEKSWTPFLAAMAERLGCQAAILVLQVPGATMGVTTYTHNAQLEAAGNYFAQYIALDPLVNLPDSRIVSVREHIAPMDLENTDFYRHCLAPAGLRHALGIDLREERRYLARVRLARTAAQGYFSSDENALLGLVLPHIKAALSVRIDADRTRVERTHYAEAMDRLEMAAIVLDESGRVIYTSPLADSLLAERNGIFMVKDFLTLSSHEDTKTFREMVGRCIEARRKGRPSGGEVMRIHRGESKTDLSVIVRPYANQPGDESSSLASSVAVFLHAEPDEQARDHFVPSDSVQKLFGLTAKEASVALRLASGRTLQEAAEDLGITQSTARAHLRSIFAKTGIDRQTKLVRALLKSVAMLGL